MNDLQVTSEDRAVIKDFIDSGVFKKLFDYAIEKSRTVCEAPSDRILYFQGVVSGIREFGRLIENYSKSPNIDAVTNGVFEKFRSIGGRKA